jgi:hypothetical protein
MLNHEPGAPTGVAVSIVMPALALTENCCDSRPEEFAATEGKTKTTPGVTVIPVAAPVVLTYKVTLIVAVEPLEEVSATLP